MILAVVNMTSSPVATDLADLEDLGRRWCILRITLCYTLVDYTTHSLFLDDLIN